MWQVTRGVGRRYGCGEDRGVGWVGVGGVVIYQQPAPNDEANRDHHSGECYENAKDEHDQTTQILIIQIFFISNDLTCHKKFLVRRARRAKRNENIHDCWFYDGQIIIKHLSIKIMLINWKKNLDGIDPVTEVV